MPSLRMRAVLLHFGLVACSIHPNVRLCAQQLISTQPSRVTRGVDLGSRVPLPGNLHPLATAENDRGPAPLALRADRLTIVLQRSAQQEANLQTYLHSLQDPNSANYRQWLTPAEFGQRFGVSDADIAAVQSWLESQGFTITRIPASRMAIEFSGTVAQVQTAFQTPIHSYVVHGEQHWANASAPQIPTALAPVIAGVASLNNFSPRSMAVRGPSGNFGVGPHLLQPALTTGDATNGFYLYFGPADAATVYNLPTSLNASHSGSLYDGSGVTIGIAGDSNIDVAQNANYRATFGLPANPTTVVVDGSDPGKNGDAIEAYLDTQVAGGIAPNANVVLYTAADTYLNAGLFLAITRALDDNKVDILNVSFGACESAMGAALNQYLHNLWQQAAAQGISVTVSTGDSGSAGCDNQNTATTAQLGLGVNGLASTPYNIAVGGTDFDALYSNFPSSFTSYVNTGNTYTNHRSALKYIPERPWNNSTYFNRNSNLQNNLAWNLSNFPGNQNIVAAGGGVSSCVTVSGTSCSAGYPVPSWQSSFAASATGRNLPDVSLLAGNGLYGAIWALCTDLDTDSTGQVLTDCAGTPTTGNNFNVTGVGGTSAAAPALAGILALAVQKTGTRLGQADPVLYNLAKNHYAAVFHDVTAGNNSVSCVSGTPNCIATTSGGPFLSGYDTKTGYDEASGLGSLDGTQLLSNWTAAGPFAATASSLKLNASTAALTITHGTAVNVQIGVTSSSGTPTGPVALVDNIDPAQIPNSGAIDAFALASGSVTQSVNNLPGGSYKVSAHYGGSDSFAASDSNTISVTVNPEPSTTTLTVRGVYDPTTGKASATPYYGYIYLIDAQPVGNSATPANPNGAATGSIAFTGGSVNLGSARLGSDGIAELQTSLVPGGTNALKAAFPGDASFAASTSAPVSFAVTPAPSSLALSSDKSYYTAGDTAILTAKFGGSGGGPNLISLGGSPTGTVTFLDSGKVIGTGAVTGTPGSSSAFATGSASLTVTSLTSGFHQITATYAGDGNYAASATFADFFLQVVNVNPQMTVTPMAGTIKANQALVLTATLLPSGTLPAPTGTLLFAINRLDGTSAFLVNEVQLVNGKAAVTVPADTLPLGAMTFTVSYSGDSYYGTTFVSTTLQVISSGTVIPTLNLTLPSQPVNGTVPITLAVTGPAGDPVPTGSVSVSNSVRTWPLVNGTASFTIYLPLTPGPTPITVNYLGDSVYATTAVSGTVTLMSYPVINVTPTYPVITLGQPLTVTITLPSVAPFSVPTGTVALSVTPISAPSTTTYSSPAASLVTGVAAITIPGSAFTAGPNYVNISYSGDAYYLPGNSTSNVDVSTTPAGFNLGGSGVILTAGATTNNTSVINVTSTAGFAGVVDLNAQITSSPANAVHIPTLSFGSTSPITLTGGSTGSATLTISTTARTSAALDLPERPQLRPLLGGGAILAGLLLFIRPSHRRRWRTLVGMLLMLISLSGTLLACGGGGSAGGTGGTGGTGTGSSSGTTPGTYGIMVTGTSGSVTASTTLTLTVN